MGSVIDFHRLKLAKVTALAEAHDYALVETGQGYDLRCPFNGRPQVFCKDLAFAI